MNRQLLWVLALAPAMTTATPFGLPADAVLSGDGNVVAFVASRDGRSVGGPLYVFDRTTGEIERVTTGETFTNRIYGLSRDGDVVLFDVCFGLTPAAAARTEVCAYERSSGTYDVVGRDSNDDTVESDFGAISPDGSMVAFAAPSGMVTPDDANNSGRDGFRRGLFGGPTVMVTRDELDMQISPLNQSPALSGDGRFVAFKIFDASGSSLFLRDVQLGVTQRVSVNHLGNPILLDPGIRLGGMSPDGRFVTFSSTRSGVADDNDLRRDIYLRDTAMNLTELISRDTMGMSATSDSFEPFVSADGNLVAFQSAGSAFVANDNNGESDVFVRNRMSQSTTRVSVSSSDAQAVRGSSMGGMSEDGRFVLIRSFDHTLAPGAEPCGSSGGGVFCNLYLRDTLLRTTELIPPSSARLIVPPLPAVDQGDQFGKAVAIDGSRVAVGVPSDDNARGTDAGKVIVYRINGDLLEVEEEILIPDGFTAAGFGGSIALSGDLLAVGAPGTPPASKQGLSALGAALFERASGQWTLKHPLPGATGDDAYGATIAIAGTTVLVGAPSDDEGVNDSGAVYSFTTGDGAMIGKIKQPSPGAGAAFGSALAVAPGTIAIGAPGSPVEGLARGAVELYQRIGENLSAMGQVATTTSDAGDSFGASVSINGDRLLVGAPLTDGSFRDNEGAAYLFDLGGNLNAETDRITASTGAQDGRFGASVLLGDQEILVGQPGLGNGQVTRYDQSLSVIGHIVANDDQSGLGESLAGAGDRVVVGAPNSNADAGSATTRLGGVAVYGNGFE